MIKSGHNLILSGTPACKFFNDDNFKVLFWLLDLLICHPANMGISSNRNSQ
jgi:hypothetical protein